MVGAQNDPATAKSIDIPTPRIGVSEITGVGSIGERRERKICKALVVNNEEEKQTLENTLQIPGGNDGCILVRAKGTTLKQLQDAYSAWRQQRTQTVPVSPTLCVLIPHGFKLDPSFFVGTPYAQVFALGLNEMLAVRIAPERVGDIDKILRAARVST